MRYTELNAGDKFTLAHETLKIVFTKLHVPTQEFNPITGTPVAKLLQEHAIFANEHGRVFITPNPQDITVNKIQQKQTTLDELRNGDKFQILDDPNLKEDDPTAFKILNQIFPLYPMIFTKLTHNTILNNNNSSDLIPIANNHHELYNVSKYTKVVKQ